MASESLKILPVGKLRLPHPYLTTYYIVPSGTSFNGTSLLQVKKSFEEENYAPKSEPLPHELHKDNFYFSDPQEVLSESGPSVRDNTTWARAQRAPWSLMTWEGAVPPNAGQVWLVIYAILTIQPELEMFRLKLQGIGKETVEEYLRYSLLADNHPLRFNDPSQTRLDELVVYRGAFWQGSGSPFGERPAWTPYPSHSAIHPLDYTITHTDRLYRRHPRRPLKPKPGSVIYSRYITSLDQHFSLIALDYQNHEHVHLFHKWQNDPRVAKGWNETGTLEEHREYLRNQHEDPHSLPVFGRFDDTPFSYFEIFWVREDPIGAYYDSKDFDRGRHSLVGDSSFRGRHRVLAWWPSIIHYVFLDDHRTDSVIGEPIATNQTVMTYDYTFGLTVDKFIDLPHKRAALVRCSREKFFQLCPLYQGGGYVAGTRLPLPSKM